VDAFHAAARVAPDLWIPSFGHKLRVSYSLAAEEAMPQGTIATTGAPEGAFRAVDGAEAMDPLTLEGGLHLVQVGRSAQEILWAKVVFVPGSQRVTLGVPPFEMNEPVAQPRPDAGTLVDTNVTPTVAPNRAASGVFAHAALGAGTALGNGLTLTSAEGDALTEPAVKLMVPVEGGLTLRLDTVWVRGALGAAPVLGGQLVFGGGEGAAAWPMSLYGHGTVGVSIDTLDFGVAGGVSLPGRLEARGVASTALGDTPLRGELRMGINIPTERRTEPAFGLLMVWDPSMPRN
jgi:hypothetical protein